MIAGSLACGGTQQLNGLVNTKGVEMDNALLSVFHKTEDLSRQYYCEGLYIYIYIFYTEQFSSIFCKYTLHFAEWKLSMRIGIFQLANYKHKHISTY